MSIQVFDTILSLVLLAVCASLVMLYTAINAVIGVF